MNEKNSNGQDCGCSSEVEKCGCGENVESNGCDCGCDCGDQEALIVDLEDENGNIVPCEVVDGFEFKESEYAIVQNPQNQSVYLFKVEGDGEEKELVIPEEGEFEEVSAYYEQLAQEQGE
ncbi:DUF1292 domain-containing protein [Clostridium luticellarii]|jgi:hypothetical protein|uniref:DUF1292 domain-containing protein n=1 Tax=Clostridium luticellarii TaxID=1691940 RepID=A0A2T0BN28_9CLOT|nr:DUF1292 domain-containing protein [Clostridium luticellarii]PRR85222.1 hypothetical protein CLLU_17780 [Clostridium luticellarii]